MRTFELKGERFWNISRDGQQITVSWGKVGGKALKPGKYPFVGEYHSETAKATIVAE